MALGAYHEIGKSQVVQGILEAPFVLRVPAAVGDAEEADGFLQPRDRVVVIAHVVGNLRAPKEASCLPRAAERWGWGSIQARVGTRRAPLCEGRGHVHRAPDSTLSLSRACREPQRRSAPPWTRPPRTRSKGWCLPGELVM